MPQQDINRTFLGQQYRKENVLPNDINSVEFRNETPTNLSTNPKRIWINQPEELLYYTVDGIDIHTVPTSLTVNEVVTVGPGGQYATINAALAYLSHKYPIYIAGGITAEVRLKSGFIMAEQVNISGVDLGWITVTSEDAVVFIQRDAITQTLIESRRPAWFGTNKAVLPTIGVLFEYTTGIATEGYDGITVAYGSRVRLLPGSGVNKPARGLGAYYSSEAFCYMNGLTEGGAGEGAGSVKGVYFQDCKNRAFMASFGSRIHCARAQLQRCQADNAVYVIWASIADIYQSDISSSLNTAVHARDGSRINARETNVNGSGRGYHALHNAEINARYHANEWSGDGAKNCREYGVIASYNSRIEASELPVDGSDIGVHASNGSTVTFFDAATAKTCRIGIYATNGSIIDCGNANASNCTDTGIRSDLGSTVNASAAIANNCVNNGFQANGASTINANTSSANFCIIGYSALGGSRINCTGSSAQSCGTYGVNSFEGSSVDAQAVNTTGSGTGFRIARGAIIAANNTTGTTSNPPNAITANGIIFQ